MSIKDWNGNGDEHKYLVNVFINGVQLCCCAVDKDGKGKKQKKLFNVFIKKLDELGEGEMHDLAFKGDVKITLKGYKKPDESEEDSEDVDDIFA